jgi:hypothetical protein
VSRNHSGGAGATGTSSVSTGGNVTGPCGTDCSSIQAPQCSRSVCNEQSGECEVVTEDDGLPCDDGLFCTAADACAAGACVGPPNDCGMAAPQCNVVGCNESTQTCSSVPAAELSPCQTANLCMNGEYCTNGVCGNGNLEPDVCDFTPIPPCHIAICNPMTGMCDPQPGNEGQGCVDPNDLCTAGKTCASGVCQGGGPKSCSQLDQACNLGVCDSMSGNCTTQPVMNGQTCDDLNGCTNGEICTNGACGGGTPQTQCMNGDMCCPSGCTINNDLDCVPLTVLPAIHRGWWRDNGSHSANNDNTLTGVCCGSQDHNAYFIFDLSGVQGTTVTSAEVHIELENYSGASITTNLTLWDVSTPAVTVEANGPNLAVYTDLETGTAYGSFSVTAQDLNTVVVIPLNNQALTDIANAIGGQFVIGVDNVGATAPQDYVRWSVATEMRTHELHVQVY